MFESLVGLYFPGKPKRYDSVATSLRSGTPPLAVRNQMMEEDGMTRLEAGKIVESVQKTIKASKTSLVIGPILLVLGVFSLPGFFAIVMTLAGIGQTVAGFRGWRMYQSARYGEDLPTI